MILMTHFPCPTPSPHNNTDMNAFMNDKCIVDQSIDSSHNNCPMQNVVPMQKVLQGVHN